MTIKIKKKKLTEIEILDQVKKLLIILENEKLDPLSIIAVLKTAESVVENHTQVETQREMMKLTLENMLKN